MAGLGQLFSDESQRFAKSSTGLVDQEAAGLAAVGDDYHMAKAKQRALGMAEMGHLDLNDTQSVMPFLQNEFLRSKTGGQQGLSEGMFDRASVFNSAVANPMRRAVQGIRGNVQDTGLQYVRSTIGDVVDGKETIGMDVTANPSALAKLQAQKNKGAKAKDQKSKVTFKQKAFETDVKKSMDVLSLLDSIETFNPKDAKQMEALKAAGIDTTQLNPKLLDGQMNVDQYLNVIDRSSLSDLDKQHLIDIITSERAGLTEVDDEGNTVVNTDALETQLGLMGIDESQLGELNVKQNVRDNLVGEILNNYGMTDDQKKLNRLYADNKVTGLGDVTYSLDGHERTAKGVEIEGNQYVMLDRTDPETGDINNAFIPFQEFQKAVSEGNFEATGGKYPTEVSQYETTLDQLKDNISGIKGGYIELNDQIKELENSTEYTDAEKQNILQPMREYAHAFDKVANAVSVKSVDPTMVYAQFLKDSKTEATSFTGFVNRLLRSEDADQIRENISGEKLKPGEEFYSITFDELIKPENRSILGRMIGMFNEEAGEDIGDKLGIKYSTDADVQQVMQDQNTVEELARMEAQGFNSNQRSFHVAQKVAELNMNKNKAALLQQPAVKKMLDRTTSIMTQLGQGNFFPKGIELTSEGKQLQYEYSDVSNPTMVKAVVTDPDGKVTKIPISLLNSRNINNGLLKLYNKIYNTDQVKYSMDRLNAANIKGITGK